MPEHATTLVAFLGTRLLARGTSAEVVLACRRQDAEFATTRLAIYDATNGQVLDIDLSGDEATVLSRLGSHPVLASRVAGREVRSPNRRSKTHDRRALDAAYRFMHDLVGDIGGFEEASRALFAGDDEAFARETSEWPLDVRDQLARFRNAATL